MEQHIVIALGGNAIKSAGQKGTFDEQYKNVSITTSHIAKIVQAGHKVIVTHGNGPQVGDLLLQHAAARDYVSPMPMFLCVAQSQGSIGYLIQQTLQNHLFQIDVKKDVATIITQVLVDKKDPAFKSPTKPVGPFYKSEEEFAEDKEKGYVFIEDAGRGFRRVVPSPMPKEIVELDSIKSVSDSGIVVIACGGGGIPVVDYNGDYHGIDAVIDKDRAGQLLATEAKADTFMVLTDVEKVALNYNTPKQKDLDKITVEECKKYIEEGHFAPGSMLPKMEACIKFVENGGKKAIITHPFVALQALEGQTGTTITK
jgi:carbamate kinase